jgi:hypothetical protein
MAWYDVGTVSVTNGSTTVTGSGTDFISGVQVGEGLYIGGDLYEIGVINSSTQLTLSDAYLGSTATGQAYKIIPTQSLVADLSSGVADLISDFADVRDYAGNGKFNDGTQASPAITFTQDQNNGLYRIGSDNWGMSAGGQLVADVSTNGVGLPDSKKLTFGASDDLQIFHDGGNSVIKDGGTGDLYIQGQGLIRLTNDGASEHYAKFNNNGAVQLYYDNAEKIKTTSTGVDVTGTVTADGLTAKINTGSFNSDTKIESVVGDVTFNYDTFGGSGNYAGSIDFYTKEATGSKRIRQRIKGNGDVQFYEDTGTTAKFVWDASAESLGIGTSTPFDSSIHATGKIRAGGGASGGYFFGSVDFDTGMTAPTDGNLAFTVNATERMRIDSSGNVGIGTASPNELLHVRKNQQDDTAIMVSNIGTPSANTSCSFVLSEDGSNAKGWFRRYRDGTARTTIGYDGAFTIESTNGSERARIDSSGNLLVGTTSTSWLTGAGHRVFNNGSTTSTVANGTVGSFNRLYSDGEIVNFRRSGTAVGSIGSVIGQYLRIGSSDTGIMFQDGTSSIEPRAETSNNDGAINLGAASNRFKDLYLSGGVYLGGTGAANKLDDYETGAFSLAPEVNGIRGTTTNPTYTISRDANQYIKIGDYVTLYIDTWISGLSSEGAGSLYLVPPFTSASVGSGGEYYGAVAYSVGFDVEPYGSFVDNGLARIYLMERNGAILNTSALSSTTRFRFSVTYRAA